MLVVCTLLFEVFGQLDPFKDKDSRLHSGRVYESVYGEVGGRVQGSNKQ